MSLLHDDVDAALNIHMGREFGAHFQYLGLAAYFEEEALAQLSGFFRVQAAEEHMHAMKFYDYILEAGGHVDIPAIPASGVAPASAEAAVQTALDWEMDVTRHINGLVDLARAHSDHQTEAFLQWFVTEQVEEVSTMDELLRVVRRAGESQLLLVEDFVARRPQPVA